MISTTETLSQRHCGFGDRLSGYGDEMIVHTPALSERSAGIASGHVDLPDTLSSMQKQ